MSHSRYCLGNFRWPNCGSIIGEMAVDCFVWGHGTSASFIFLHVRKFFYVVSTTWLPVSYRDLLAEWQRISRIIGLNYSPWVNYLRVKVSVILTISLPVAYSVQSSAYVMMVIPGSGMGSLLKYILKREEGSTPRGVCLIFLYFDL